MKESEAKELARGIAAICMPNTFDSSRPRPFDHEAALAYSQDMLDKLYSVFLHIGDEEFLQRLKQAGSLVRDTWREPQEVKGLLADELSNDLDKLTGQKE